MLFSDNISFGQFATKMTLHNPQKGECPNKPGSEGQNEGCYSTSLTLTSIPVLHIDCIVPIKQVSCGKEHVLLLAASGSVYTFGLGR